MTTAAANHEEGQKAAQAEAAILDAARDLLAAGGVDGLSMRHVAEQVGISATAIYHYFEGKQDLVNRVVIHAFQRFGAYLTTAMESHPEGSVERISALGEAYLTFALENQAYFRVLFSMQPKDPAVFEEVPEGGGYHLLRRAVADAIEVGSIRADTETGPAEAGTVTHADLVSMYLWSTAHGLVTLALCGASSRCECGGLPSVIDLYRSFIPFIAGGIAAQRGGQEEPDK
ncbi:MAG: TetR/AcrR family transcriptional regulator [Gemmatimonadales bacterium]|jgi:AcrR family transcriptional regulator